MVMRLGIRTDSIQCGWSITLQPMRLLCSVAVAASSPNAD